jgi:hypothetical protein
MDKQEFSKIREVFSFLWKDLNRWKIPEEVEVVEFRKQETAVNLGELVREIVRLDKGGKRSKSFNASVDEKESREIETQIGYPKGGYTRRWDEHAPTFGSIVPEGAQKIQSAFLPSPKAQSKLKTSADLDNIISDDSSLFMPVGYFEDQIDISSMNNDSYQNNKMLKNLIQNSNKLTKHNKTPKMFKNKDDITVSPKGTIYQAFKKPELIVQKEEDTSESMTKIARDWVNQDLPIYPQTSKFSNLRKYHEMASQMDSSGKAVYRTLEVSEDMNSTSSHKFSRIKSEDRQEKKRKKSRKRKEKSKDANFLRKVKHAKEDHSKQKASKTSQIGWAFETEVYPKEASYKCSYDRAFSCDIKSDKGERDYLQNRRDSSQKKATYYELIKSQVNNANKKKNRIIENYSHNRLKMQNLSHHENHRNGGVQPSVYEEYLNTRKSPTSSTLTTKFMSSKISRDYNQNSEITQKGLFSKNERINSKKLYFHNFGESLNRQSLEWSRSTITEKELKSAVVPQTQNGEFNYKKSFFSQALQNRNFGW